MPATDTAGLDGLPDTKVSARAVFGIDTDLEVPAFSQASEHVPDRDPDYLFDRETTLAILAGFARKPPRHGHRLSRHRQIHPYRAGGGAAQLACVRVNLDSHVSRIDLVGKDAIVLKDGQQVTEFKDGSCPGRVQAQCRAVLRRI